MLIWRSFCFFPEALPAPPFAVQTSHPLTCKFLDGTNASLPLIKGHQALYSWQIPRQGEEPVLLAWALLPPHGMPPILVPLCLILCPYTKPSGHPLCQPASCIELLLWPCFLGLAPLPSAQLGSSRTVSWASSHWGLKRATKQPLPTHLPQLFCRSLHSSPVSSFPPPPLPFILLHSRSLMTWGFSL